MKVTTGYSRIQIALHWVVALLILFAWLSGEGAEEAMELVELACRKHPEIKTAEALVPLIYRIKQGIEA